MPPGGHWRVLVTGLNIAPVERWVSILLDAQAEVLHLGFTPIKHLKRLAASQKHYHFEPYAGLSQYSIEELVTRSGIIEQALPAECEHLHRLADEFEPHIYHAFGIDYGANVLGTAGVRPFVLSAMGYVNALVDPKYEAMDDVERSRHLPKGALDTMSRADALLVGAPLYIPRCRAILPPGVQIVYLKTGLDCQLFRPDSAIRNQARQVIGVPPDGTVVLSARGWAPIYNHHLTLEAFARALPDLPPPAILAFLSLNRSHVASEMLDYVELVRSRVNEMGLQEHVRFLPAFPQVMMPTILNAADWIISVPEQDALPLTILEALACEVPVIAGRLPVLEQTVYAPYLKLVDPHDPDQFAAALVSKPISIEARHEARRLVVKEHDSAVIARRTFDLYSRLLNPPARAEL